jgi:TatA/E family protein of Tat protein translocase
VILVVGLLVFGPNRLPEVGRQVGRALHEAKKFQARISDEIESAAHQHDDRSGGGTPPTRPAPTPMARD